MRNADTSNLPEDTRRFKRIVPSKDDCIYCIVANAESTNKTVSLMAMDLSENGFKFTISPTLIGYFRHGEKLYLKAIGGTLNVSFAEPIELSIRWQKHHAERNRVDVGFQICSISEESRKQLSESILLGLVGCPAKQHVLSIFGGHRQNGNTARILGWIEEKLKARGHKVYRINLIGKKISGCTKCLECKKDLHFPGCVQKDDAMSIISKMLKSDIVIFASPLYSRYLSVQMRSLFERFNCLCRGAYGTAGYTSFVEGQRHSLILTSIEQFEKHAEQIARSFQEQLLFNKAHSAGKLIVCNCTTPDKLDGQIKAQATVFAEQLFSPKTMPYPLLFPGQVRNGYRGSEPADSNT